MTDSQRGELLDRLSMIAHFARGATMKAPSPGDASAYLLYITKGDAATLDEAVAALRATKAAPSGAAQVETPEEKAAKLVLNRTHYAVSKFEWEKILGQRAPSPSGPGEALPEGEVRVEGWARNDDPDCSCEKAQTVVVNTDCGHDGGSWGVRCTLIIHGPQEQSEPRTEPYVGVVKVSYAPPSCPSCGYGFPDEPRTERRVGERRKFVDVAGHYARWDLHENEQRSGHDRRAAVQGETPMALEVLCEEVIDAARALDFVRGGRASHIAADLRAAVRRATPSRPAGLGGSVQIERDVQEHLRKPPKCARHPLHSVGPFGCPMCAAESTPAGSK